MALSPSRIFRQSGASFLIGIILSHYNLSFGMSFVIWLIIYNLFFGYQKLFSFFLERKRVIIYFFILLSFLAGFWRYDYFSDKLNKLAVKEENEVEIEATIIAEPVLKDNYQRIIIPQAVIYTQTIPHYQFGDVIRIKGTAQPLKDFYSYSSLIVSGKISYPRIELISSGKISFRRTAIAFKNKITRLLQKVIPEPQVGLLSSFIFGGKQNLINSLEKDIQKAGLSHIIVASGLHLSIFTKMLSGLLDIFCFGNFLSFIFSCFFLFSFSFMAGLTPSIIRAAIMAFLLVLSRFSFRLYNSVNALLLAGLTMIWFNPFLLFYDLGFQLSFLATAGILLFYPLWDGSPFWQQNIFNNSGGRIIKQTILCCFSALFLVIPWLIYKTQNVSLVTPLTNILIIPFIPLILGGGIITAIFSFFIYPLGLFFGFCLNLILIYFIKIISYFANLSWAEIFIPYALRWLIIPYYFFVFLYYRRKI